jgi:hypothetical protein
LNHRKESCVSQISCSAQKIFIKNLRSLGERRFFQMVGVAMWISGY